MKTKWIIGCAAALLLGTNSLAQDWTLGGNNITGFEWFGAGTTSTVPLSFETRVNQPMQWRTNSMLRMRLHETLTGQTIGSYTNENLSGNLGVGLFNTPNVTRPFSLLHLDNGGNQFSGYRPWHRPGMTVTNGTDLGWIGLKNEGGDLNHFTLAWADNPGFAGPDRFKMIFLANPTTNGTAGTLDGLECMRIRPAGTGTESFFGIGDWFTTGMNTDPSERLDLLDGRARIRVLPDAPGEADNLYKIMVVDDSPSPSTERGVVKWIDPATLADCDWTIAPDPGANHISTAYDTNPLANCPDDAEAVGIGKDLAGTSPLCKLIVETDNFPKGLCVDALMTTAVTTGVEIDASGGTTETKGLDIDVSGAAAVNEGAVINTSGSASSNVGVYCSTTGTAVSNQGLSLNVADATENRGLSVSASTSANAAENIGAYFRCTTGNAWAANRGVQVEIDGESYRTRGVEVDCHAGGLLTAYGGYFKQHEPASRYSHGVAAESYGADENGQSFGTLGYAKGPANLNVGAMGYSGAVQSTAGRGHFGVFGQTLPWEPQMNIGTVGYLGGNLFPNIRGRLGVAGVSRPSDDEFNVGTLGYAGVNGPMQPQATIGVYGEVDDTTAWAGYYQGNVNINGSLYLNGVYFASDEDIKENIEALDAAATQDVLGGVDVVSFNYTDEATEEMGLPEEEQVGLIAQQVQQIAPHLVKEKIQPAVMDTLGNVIQAERTILTVNYVGLVPYLLAGFQQLKAENAAMRQDIDACCALNDDGLDLPGQGGRVAITGVADLEDERLAISPNPFIGSTTVSYYLPTTGRVRLEVSDGHGRALKTLREEEAMEGSHQYVWNTESLAPGTYYVALVVDGNTIVKKAVKVSER